MTRLILGFSLLRSKCLCMNKLAWYVLLTIPTVSASSSRFNRAPASSLASRSSLAVGIPEILDLSSASYFICLSRGDIWERTVDGLRYAPATSLWSACWYTDAPSTTSTPRIYGLPTWLNHLLDHQWTTLQRCLVVEVCHGLESVVRFQRPDLKLPNDFS